MRNNAYLICLLVTLAMPALAVEEQDSSALLKKVQQRYSGLKAIRIRATRSDAVFQGKTTATGTTVYDLAEKGRDRFRLVVSGMQQGIVVSDGKELWKALPPAKQWSRISASGLSAMGEDREQDAEAPPVQQRDLHEKTEDLLIRRYALLPLIARDVQLGKEETYKLGDERIRCRLVRMKILDAQHELLIDEDRGWVVQMKQKSKQAIQGGDALVEILTKVTQIEADDQVSDDLFHFTPEPGWSETEMLVLPGETSNMHLGTKAAPIVLKSLTGESFSLAAMRGKVVVVDFWATWCPPCRAELPHVDKLRAELADKVQFVGITDEKESTVKGFVEGSKLGMTMLLDTSRSANRAYGVRYIPTVLVIDREGVIRQAFTGEQTERKLRKAIAEVVGE